MVSARTTAPRTPRIFISTVSPISSRFSGTIAERRSGDGAYANVKFPREGFPIESLRAFRQTLKCFLQKPEHAAEEQERHQPARGTRQRCSGECRPSEPELGKNVSAVQHPVPAGVSDDCGQDDRAHALRDGIAKKELECRDQQNEHEKLAKLDADVEGKKRSEQVGAGELQRLPQGEREAKSMYEAEAEGHHPAALQAAAANDVFERHINDGNGNERFNQWRKPEKIWREVVGGGDQRDRMRNGERGDDGNEHAETAKRDYKTKQKQKMVGAVENVEKTQVDKSQSGLVPARVDADETGIASEFECENFAAGWNKPKDGYDAQTQARKRWMDGKAGLLRLNWVFERHVEHGLVPVNVCVVRKGRPRDVSDRIFIRSERAIGRERDACRDDLRFRKASIVFIDFDEVGDPERRGAGEHFVHAREVQIARAVFGKIDITHGFERDANEEMKTIALRFDKCLDDDIVGDVVRGRATWKEQIESGQNRD